MERSSEAWTGWNLRPASPLLDGRRSSRTATGSAQYGCNREGGYGKTDRHAVKAFEK
jgi:hypothetical protein